MASPTQWTWVWASSGNWWWTGRPGVLPSMGCKESDTTETTELNRTFSKWPIPKWFFSGGQIYDSRLFFFPLFFCENAYKLLQSCVIFCDPMNYSPPDSSAHGILQARILDWLAISYSRRSSQPRDQTWVSSIADGFFTIWATFSV